MPEELRVEVRDIVQEAVIKTIPQKERQTDKMFVDRGTDKEDVECIYNELLPEKER